MTILRNSIKIALQQPSGIKLKLQKFVEQLEAEGGFKRSLQNQNMHKNCFYGLSYLHSIMEGRASFGSQGWNIYNGFDASDHEISAAQLTKFMRSDVKSESTMLKVIKYIFSKINYAGKIAVQED